MKGYFARKPENIDIVKGVVGEAQPDAAFWYGFREGCHFALCLPGAGSAEPDLFTKKKLP